MAETCQAEAAQVVVRTPEGEGPRLSRIGLRAAFRVLRAACGDLRVLSSELGGGVVGELEQAFAEVVDARYAVACASGTSALLAGLVACGVGPGDEVIVASYGWGGTVGAILTLGATPIFADVDACSFTLAPDRVRERISPRTVAILATHLFGHPADVVQLAEVARAHRLRLIYDAAQALGATSQGRPMGVWGDVAAFSFGRGKILSAGEGGMVVTNDPDLHDRLLLVSQHPARALIELGDASLRGYANEQSLSCRLHPVAAAICLAQMPELSSRIELRRRACLELADRLQCLASMAAPAEVRGARHAFHRFVLRLSPGGTSRREAVVAELKRLGVPATVGPVRTPIHRRNRDVGSRRSVGPRVVEDLPITDALCKRQEILLESTSDWLAVPESRVVELAEAFLRTEMRAGLDAE